MEKTLENLIRVVVLGNSDGESCARGWGPRRSSAETTRWAESYLAQTFPDRVSVAYHDVALPEVQTQFAAVIEEARNRYLPYPLVMVDDKITMAGEVNVYGLAMLISRKLRAE